MAAGARPASLQIITCDGESFNVEENLYSMSDVILQLLDWLPVPHIQLPNGPEFTAGIFNLALKIMQHIHEFMSTSSESKYEPSADKELGNLIGIDVKETMWGFVELAYYLGIQTLLDAGCYKIAMSIKGKSSTEIRQIWGIHTPTPEEEEEIRKANPWLEEQ